MFKSIRNDKVSVCIYKSETIYSCDSADPDMQVLSEHGIQIEIVKDAVHTMAWENPEGLASAISNAIQHARTIFYRKSGTIIAVSVIMNWRANLLVSQGDGLG
ncbi:MAG: hypothetical protein GXX04_06975 [Clostridiaceae bacterium]|nr:hypothetical protein [Clostridiaceae bacterium]